MNNRELLNESGFANSGIIRVSVEVLDEAFPNGQFLKFDSNYIAAQYLMAYEK